MKKILLFLSIILFLPDLQAKNIPVSKAVLRTMDKITGRVQEMTVKVGEQFQVGTLSVTVEKCLKKPPEETPENSAFLTVTDSEASNANVFRGWMFSSNPALSAMEHPVYDIWIVECGSSSKQKQVSQTPKISEKENLNEPIED